MNSTINFDAQTGVPIPKKVRRVGVFTLGFSLVATGILLLIFMFGGAGLGVILLKLTPIILILLGGELIYFTARYKDQKIKCDFLSVLLCFVLVCGSLGVSVALPFITQYGPERYVVTEQVQAKLQQEILDELSPLGYLQDVTVHLNFLQIPQTNATTAAIGVQDNLQTYIDFAKEYPDKLAFVADCTQVLEKLNALNMPIDTLSLSSQNYELHLSSTSMRANQQLLLGMVSEN